MSGSKYLFFSTVNLILLPNDTRFTPKGASSCHRAQHWFYKLDEHPYFLDKRPLYIPKRYLPMETCCLPKTHIFLSFLPLYPLYAVTKHTYY